MSDSPTNSPTRSRQAGALPMFVSSSQAGIMIVFGIGLLFGAVLLGVTAFTLRVGSAIGVSLVVGIILIVWIGVGFIANAIAMRRTPVFELFPDRLVCHDLEGTYEVSLSAIAKASVDERRGIPALIIEAEGRRIVIPSSLTNSDRVFETLLEAASAPPLDDVTQPDDGEGDD